jgi:hypothetical protein
VCSSDLFSNTNPVFPNATSFSASNDFIISTITAVNPIKLRTDYTDRLTIDGGGNVGVGVISPSVPLSLFHVNGVAQIGTTGSTLGQLTMAGNTSGLITIKGQAASGTYNFNLPTTAGTAGQILTSQGGGSNAMTWTSASGGISGLTTNELVYGNSATTIASLPVATYPSLTELSYVKGLTSSAQTQINAKIGALAAVGATPNANGATISGSTLNLEPASATLPGVMTAGNQSLGGQKTWNDLNIITATLNGTLHYRVTNNSTGTSAQADFRALNSAGDLFALGIYGTGTTTYGALTARSALNYCSSPSGFVLMADNAAGNIRFATGGNTERWRISNGGFLSNTAADGTAYLMLKAGTASASTAPIKLTTGTVNITAEAGAIEYTTPQLFFTNGRAERQEIPQIQQSRVSTQYDNTTTTLGNVTGLTANVAASGTYRFEAKLFTTSDVAGGIKVAIGGTATATAIRYEGLTTDAGLTTQSRSAAMATVVGAVTAVTAAWVTIHGTITVNGAGTLTVQAAANVATGTTSVLTGSTFVLTEIL